MKVMVLVKATRRSEAGEMPEAGLVEAMGRYNDALLEAGVLLGGEGLKPSREATRVRFGGSRLAVEPGPFVPAEEQVAGFWLWEVKSMEEALEWAKRCPHPMPGEEAVLELRPIFGAEDFGEAMSPEEHEREARQREVLEGRKQG